MREVQVIEIVPADKQFEQYVFTISEPDFGFFAVSFEDPETGEIWTSKLLTVTPSAEEFKELIVGYFNREPRNSDIDVVLESNLDDLIFTYTVTLKRLIPNLSS
jgi:hypothetical protein